jgi:fructose-1,6-bisphosphatase II
MYDPGSSYYMKKLVVGPAARDVVDIDAPVEDNLKAVARALGKDVNDITVFVLDKPRHKQLIADIRKAGARITLHTDGDVAGSLMVVDPNVDVDVMMGTGGTPEGVISACAIKGLGGQIFGRFDPQSQAERDIMIKEGTNLNEVLSVESLIKADDAFFAATGISGGTFLGGVSYTGTGAVTHSLMIRAKTGTFRYLEAHHNLERLMKFSSVRYD